MNVYVWYGGMRFISNTNNYKKIKSYLSIGVVCYNALNVNSWHMILCSNVISNSQMLTTPPLWYVIPRGLVLAAFLFMEHRKEVWKSDAILLITPEQDGGDRDVSSTYLWTWSHRWVIILQSMVAIYWWDKVAVCFLRFIPAGLPKVRLQVTDTRWLTPTVFYLVFVFSSKILVFSSIMTIYKLQIYFVCEPDAFCQQVAPFLHILNYYYQIEM